MSNNNRLLRENDVNSSFPPAKKIQVVEKNDDVPVSMKINFSSFHIYLTIFLLFDNN